MIADFDVTVWKTSDDSTWSVDGRISGTDLRSEWASLTRLQKGDHQFFGKLWLHDTALGSCPHSMEKTRAKEKEPAGLAMLQTTTRRQQVVGQHSPPQKDGLRKWQPSKVRSPKKGLGEIEEIDKEESSMKTMHALERFIRGHPTVWKESAAQHLITVKFNRMLTPKS